MATSSKKAASSQKAGTKTTKLPGKLPAATSQNAVQNGTGKFSSEVLHKALQEHFGFDKFKGNQEPIIRNLLSGHDTFVIKPTGGGKSLCYQFRQFLARVWR